MIRSALLLASLLIALPLRATTYTLEPDYAQGVVRWDHLGFSSPAAQFAQRTGTLEPDQAHPEHCSVKVTIPALHVAFTRARGAPECAAAARWQERSVCARGLRW